MGARSGRLDRILRGSDPPDEPAFVRMHPPELRRRLRDHATRWLDRNPPGGLAVEAYEMRQDAGGEETEHHDPADPPRRRANSRRGHGSFASRILRAAGVLPVPRSPTIGMGTLAGAMVRASSMAWRCSGSSPRSAEGDPPRWPGRDPGSSHRA